MVIDKKVIDNNIDRIVTEGLNGDGNLFSDIRNKEYSEALERVKSDAAFKHITLTNAQVENSAKEQTLKSMSARIKSSLNTAEAAGDDKTNMIGFVIGMAFGGGGTDTGSMIMNIIKGESPFWKTVQESFSKDGGGLSNFTDRWKENVQKASLEKFSKEYGVSSEVLTAELSKTNVSPVQLVLAKEPAPALPISPEEKAKLDTEQQAKELSAKAEQERRETAEAVEKALKGMRIDAVVQRSIQEEKARLSKGQLSGGAHIENGTPVVPGAISDGSIGASASKS